MIKTEWKLRFREMYPNLVINRVPIDESPEEVICEIDPALTYLNRSFRGSNYLYLVRDMKDGLEKVLKVASAPARIGVAQHEHEIFQRLEPRGISGIPKLFAVYNSTGQYNSDMFTAMLRERIDGEEFDVRLRDEEVFKRLSKLTQEINNSGISLPRDFKSGNIIVNKEGQPYLIDLEESTIGLPGYYISDHKKVYDFFIYHVQAQLEKSRKPLDRLFSKFPSVSRFIAKSFYKGPPKPINF